MKWYKCNYLRYNRSSKSTYVLFCYKDMRFGCGDNCTNDGQHKIWKYDNRIEIKGRNGNIPEIPRDIQKKLIELVLEI